MEIAKLALTLDNEKRLKKYSISSRINDSLKSNNIPKRRKESVKYVSSNVKENNVKKNLENSSSRHENSPQKENNVKKPPLENSNRREKSSQKQNVKRTLKNSTCKLENSPQKTKIIDSNSNLQTNSFIISMINIPRQFCTIQ